MLNCFSLFLSGLPWAGWIFDAAALAPKAELPITLCCPFIVEKFIVVETRGGMPRRLWRREAL